ncbi:MAG: hypothetical protein OEV40_11355 [Acidimicrobiia bacterium]|nr:hypothetical protein [Acidimicrobiia bacterium]
MSFIGTGGEDWVELDMDLFERSRSSQLKTLLVDQGHVVAEALGTDFEVEAVDDGIVFIVINGKRRYRAEVGRDDRLILTGILDPDGPL